MSYPDTRVEWLIADLEDGRTVEDLSVAEIDRLGEEFGDQLQVREYADETVAWLSD